MVVGIAFVAAAAYLQHSEGSVTEPPHWAAVPRWEKPLKANIQRGQVMSR